MSASSATDISSVPSGEKSKGSAEKRGPFLFLDPAIRFTSDTRLIRSFAGTHSGIVRL
jgi:hypothetical protein